MGPTAEKDKKNFFETAAGIITGITALLVAITGFIAVLNSLGCFKTKTAATGNHFEGSFTGSVLTATMPKFGSDAVDENGLPYCFYSCTYDNLILKINLDEAASDFHATYSENVLNGCPSSATLPTQPFTAKSVSFAIDTLNKRVTIDYAFSFQTTTARFPHTARFTGKIYSDNTIKGELVIRRPDFKNFPGYLLPISTTLHLE